MKPDKLKYIANIDKSTFEVLNSEFIKAKAYILYYGDNRNKSRLSKETVEAALPSLYNIPVVAEYIEKKEDFGTHGGKIVISDDGIEFVQTTKPYGLVPESCNARWEMVEDKEYLVADIILWSGRYSELEKTVSEYSNQSMEINVLDGSWLDQENTYDISKFEFSALCLLGQSVEPCFEQAKVVVYGLDEFKQEMDEMFKKYKEFVSQEDKNVSIPEIKVEFSSTYRQKREALQNALDPKIERDQEDNVIYEEYMWVEDFDDQYVFVEKSIWEPDNYERKYGRLNYIFDETTITATITGEFEEMVLVWLTIDENQKLQDERANMSLEIEQLNNKLSDFEVLKTKVSDYENSITEKDQLISQLTEYKNKNEYQIIKFDIESLLEEFETTLENNSEFQTLKDNINNSFDKEEIFMSLNDLEKELYAIEGRMKHKFKENKQKKQNFSRVSIDIDTNISTGGQYGSAEKYIKKN